MRNKHGQHRRAFSFGEPGKRRNDILFKKMIDRKRVRSIYFRPRHARAPVYFDNNLKREIFKERIFLTSTEREKSITRPIFEKPRRIECMGVIPVTSWKRPFHHEYMKQKSTEEQARTVVVGSASINENNRSF